MAALPPFPDSPLWIASLKERPDDPQADARRLLREAFFRMREKAAVLVAQIPGDIPGLTVHDVSHLDALWSMASMIAGEDYLNPKNFTPAEAFVLGGAILLHDAAMSLAAYPNGMEGLRLTDQWRDEVTRLKAAGVAETDIEKQALPAVLRARHAIQAQEIATKGWPAKGGREYLIEDGELRTAYGPNIGKIAHSHWWSVSRLPIELGKSRNAARGLPNEWTVDPVKVACLLRVADAADLSAKRAPRFLMAITRPAGVSALHWTFQNMLGEPRVEDDSVIYTSLGAGFSLDEADAWWLCHESLTMVQGELRAVDILLSDTKRPRLQVREVKGAGSPERLAEWVEVDGWQPVDARVTISDVPALVRTLGGAQLYGDDPTVPLRELIQNACDAIRARRILQKKPESWGTITVRFDETAEGTWLEVLDDGIGMSPRVMTGPLLDFGKSFWRSSMAAEEFPGLAAAGMEATGRFGIGFYSVFMLGDRVTVTSRRYDAGYDQTETLEFRGGVEMRPILRAPTESERMEEPGTRVRVLLTKRPDEQGGILCCAEAWGGSEIAEPSSLLAFLAPAIDANLNFSKDGRTDVCVRANDWIALDGDKLLERIFSKSRRPSPHERKTLERCAQNLRLVTDEQGKIYGRGCVSVDRSFGIVAVGGYYAEQVSGISGIFLGATDLATRNVAALLAPADVLSRWSSEQANVLSSLLQENPDVNPAGIIAGCGGDISGLKFVRNRGINLDKEEFAKEIKGFDKIYLCDDGDLSYDSDADDVIEREFESGFIPNADVFFICRRKSPRYGSIFTGRSVYSYKSPCPFKEMFMKSLKEVWVNFQVEEDFECIGSVNDTEIRRYASIYSRFG